MKTRDKDGSFERMAHPAKRGRKGVPDSRSATLTPQEWATLKAAIRNIRSVRTAVVEDYGAADSRFQVAITALEEVMKSMRRRRPRGVSGRAERAEGRPQ